MAAVAALLLSGGGATGWNTMLGACACPRLTSLNRSLAGHGFHRRLVMRPEAASLGGDQCLLLLLQALPSGAFADADQLAADARVGGARTLGSARCSRAHVAAGLRWQVFGAAERERPAPECSSSVAALQLSRAQLVGGGALELPLHARYPAPCSAPPLRTQVELPPPLLLQRCAAGGDWAVAPPAHQPDALHWAVPCGDAAARSQVERVTAAVTAACAAALLAACASQLVPPD